MGRLPLHRQVLVIVFAPSAPFCGQTPMTYKQEITWANTQLGRDPRVVFLGYGITKTHAMGTLKDVPPAQLIEMPVAENLMAGAAIGMALAGARPVVYFERCDFILNALDAIVNHLNALPIISKRAGSDSPEFSPAVIFRVVVGNKRKPLFTGHTHTQDFAESLRLMVNFPVHRLLFRADIAPSYGHARKLQAQGKSCALFEYKDEM
jgi:pyruvate/2-oxoglutarate/acetoin dehydrogenase E1 component